MNLLVDFILIGGIFATLLILFLLVKSKRKALPQKLLVVFFISLCCFLLNSYAENHSIPILFVITFLISFCIEVLLGPLIFIYIKSLFEDNQRLIKENWFHFIPVVLYTFFITIPLLIYIFTEEYPFKYIGYLNENNIWASAITMLYLIIYLLVSLKLFYKYSKAMQLNFSSIGNEDFKWVRNMLLGALMVSCIELSTTFYEIFVTELSGAIENITLVSVIIWIGYLGYYGINQAKILLPDFLIHESTAIKNSKESVIRISRFSDSEAKELQGSLETILKTEKPYLDEELTLGKLAQLIPTTDKKLSTLLNQYMNTNFYDLINKYRVESVKEKLISGKHKNLTLLGIAYESGFKSKTSFNRIFKRETGVSPSQYKKNR